MNGRLGDEGSTSWRFAVMDCGLQPLQSLARYVPGDCLGWHQLRRGASLPPQFSGSAVEATAELFFQPGRFAASAMVAATISNGAQMINL